MWQSCSAIALQLTTSWWSVATQLLKNLLKSVKKIRIKGDESSLSKVFPLQISDSWSNKKYAVENTYLL